MTAAERLAYARWLREIPRRASMFQDDRARLELLADELEQEAIEDLAEQHRAARALT